MKKIYGIIGELVVAAGLFLYLYKEVVEYVRPEILTRNDMYDGELNFFLAALCFALIFHAADGIVTMIETAIRNEKMRARRHREMKRHYQEN